MQKVSELTVEHLIESACKKIYADNQRDLIDLQSKLEAIYIVDVQEFGLDEQHAVIECCLETYSHCAEMTCDTLRSMLREIIPWLEQHVKNEGQ